MVKCNQDHLNLPAVLVWRLGTAVPAVEAASAWRGAVETLGQGTIWGEDPQLWGKLGFMEPKS